MCDELTQRGRCTAALVTAAAESADPLPGTALVIDEHGALHRDRLPDPPRTAGPADRLVAAHASASAAAALVAVLHPSRQPAQPVPALTHPAPWAQNMNIDGSLRTDDAQSDDATDADMDDPGRSPAPAPAPEGPSSGGEDTRRQDPCAADVVQRDALAAGAGRDSDDADPAAETATPPSPAGTVPLHGDPGTGPDEQARNGARPLSTVGEEAGTGLLDVSPGAPDVGTACEHRQPTAIGEPREPGPARASAVDVHARHRLELVGLQDPDLDDDLARWHDPNPAPAAPMIGILGEPTVRAPGPTPPYRLPWYTEVLVYLALHPHGVSPDKAQTDLWPDGRRVELNAVRHAMHGARKWAGLDRRTDPPTAFVSTMRGDGRYRLRGHLLDWELFQRLRKRGQARAAAGHPGAVADYQAALGLVRGPVLSVLREGGYAWLFNADQRHDLHIPGFIVDTAHELVDLALTATDSSPADTATARWAADLARRIDPDATFDRPLTDLMRIAAAEDNQAELHRLAALLLDARGFDVPEELAPETFAIVDDLLPAGLTRPAR
jgi:hypothetical protein